MVTIGPALPQAALVCLAFVEVKSIVHLFTYAELQSSFFQVHGKNDFVCSQAFFDSLLDFIGKQDKQFILISIYLACVVGMPWV